VRVAAALIVLAIGGIARPLLAANARSEAAALDALNKAEGDYLSMDYAAGAARLDKALRVCAPANCSAGTQAALLRDVGTMEFRAGDKAYAVKAFGEALKLEPAIDLNPSYDAPDLRAAWEEVKTPGTGRPPATAPTRPAAAEPSVPPPPPPAPPPPPVVHVVPPPPTFDQPKGDFAHTPVAEQRIDTPLPVHIEGGPAGVHHVVLRYKHSGESDDAQWRYTVLSPAGKGWEALIPCDAVLAGTVRYYIQAYDKDMDPVGAGGDAKHPYQVPIREELAGKPPHLPDKSPPRACHEKAKTEEAPKSEKETPNAPAATGSARERVAEKPAEARNGDGPLRRWWVGVSMNFDLVQLPSGNNLCHLTPSGLPDNDKHIYCTDSSGADFPAGQAVNGELSPGNAGQSSGGTVPADLRFFASVDYAVDANFLVGGRAGWVFLRYPGKSAVADNYAVGNGFYGEARATYVVGKDALRRAPIASLFFAGAGVSAFDAHTSSSVSLNAGTPAAKQVPVNLWWTNGPLGEFLDFGGGVRYAPLPQVAVIGALRLNLSFGNNGLIPTLGPEIGGQFGF
jgi:hypothetical protein